MTGLFLPGPSMWGNYYYMTYWRRWYHLSFAVSLLIASEVFVPLFWSWFYINQWYCMDVTDHQRGWHIISTTFSLSQRCPLLSTFWGWKYRGWNYIDIVNLPWWYYRSFCLGSAKAIISVVRYFPAYADWCWMSDSDHWGCLCLRSDIAVLTACGLFLPYFWRYLYLNPEDLKPLIPMLSTIGYLVLACTCWFYWNSYWHQPCYYLIAAIAVLTVIGLFLPALFEWYIMSERTWLRSFYLGSAIAVFSPIIGLILLSFLELVEYN